MTRTAGLAASLLITAFGAVAPATESPQDIEFFEKKVRPLLVKHCYECHSAESGEPEGGLLLDRKSGWEKGGELGPAIAPGDPDKSLLIRAVRYRDSELQMPPTGKLPDEEIAFLEAWVKRGAPDPRTDTPAVASQSPAWSLDDGRKHWAFQPVADPALPPVKDQSWPQSPIDFFILAELEKHALHPAPAADKRTLIRRATFDLTGLPPTPQEVDEFLADDSPEAFARVIDRLLDSPRYGERWGRHWLDVARYADSNGLDENIAHGNAWRYRDWVVSAFNRDLPFADFLVWQLAGDLLSRERRVESPEPESSKEPDATSNLALDSRLSALDSTDSRERLIATGFLTLGPKVLAESDQQKMRWDIVDEQIDTVGKAFLGLTLGCARCHDHKFDPVPTTDYYALAGIFGSTETMESYARIARWYEHFMPTPEEAERQKQHQESLAAKKSEMESIVKSANEQLLSTLGEGAEIPKDAETRYPEETKSKLKTARDELAKLEKTPPEISSAMGVKDGAVADVAVQIRGSHLSPGEVVPRRFPQVLAGVEQSPLPGDQSGRLQLAQWMADPQHPLTWRVFVNRIWRWRFGEGIVPSTDNFGLLGEAPTNQPLLDYLARRFIASGGSVKAMHRLFMLSSTYQMSGAYDARAATVDPANRLLWRRPPQRLEAEAIRDSLLFVGGILAPKMGGSLLHVKNREFLFDHTSKDQTTYQHYQRSLYLPVIRNHVYDALELFDFPDPAVLNGDRAVTTVAPQSLFLMNSEVAWESTDRLAQSLLADSNLDDRGRVGGLYETTLSRPPLPDEVDRAISFVAQFEATYAEETSGANDGPLRAWQALCQAVVASNEFIYVQ